MKKLGCFLCALSVAAFVSFIVLSGQSPLASTQVYADEAGDSVKLPVVMYHSMLNSRSGVYIVSERQFENDLKAFLDAGFTTVLPSEIIDYVEGKGSLPSKPLLITFDDGHYNNMYYAYPILKKYGCKAVINVIGRFTEYSTASGDSDNPNYSHLTWDEIAELSGSGVIEIGNHTYNMHNFKPRYGAGPMYGETDDKYTKALCADIGKLQTKLLEVTGKNCPVFAYPFGKYCEQSEKTVAEMGFKITLTCNEGVSTVKRGDLNSLKLMRRVNRSGAYCTETVLSKISK